MRYCKLLLCVPLLAIAACSDDDGVTTQGPPAPAASVRFINAVVDTGTVDLSFIDRLENLPTMKGVAFRGTSGFYQRVGPGNRAARVFPYDTALAVTSQHLVDTNLALQANQRYTLVYAGRANPNLPGNRPAEEGHRLVVIEDPSASALPTPATGSIAIQALNLLVGAPAVDVYIVPVATAAAATPADWRTNNVGVLRSVDYLGKAADYVTVPVRPTTGLPLYRFVVAPAGSAAGVAPLFAVTPSAADQAGAAATGTAGPRPGTQISGSVLTAVIAPGSTPGTRGSAAANQNPAVIVIADKVLNQ
jgi:hypothetical protein